MVAKWARYWLMLCGGLIMCGGSQAGELNLQLQLHQVEWGQVINAKLTAQDGKAELVAIDLAPLYEDFAVLVRENISSADTAKIQTLSLELYPRRIGTLTVPALTLGDLRSQTDSVVVSSAMVGDTAISVDLNISAQQVWQRQQLLVTVLIKSADRFFNVEAEPFKTNGFEVRPFVMSREAINGDPYYRSSIQLGWVIFPLISGEFSLELPLIRYQQAGRTQHRFFLPRQAIKVHELPAYIPPNMPVAKVDVASSIVANGMLSSNQIAFWNITLKANGTLVYWLPPVLHGVQSTSLIEFLSAKSRPEMMVGVGGVQAQVTHEVPFKPQNIGTVSLPRLKVQYFDPDTGRIETFYHQTASHVVWNIPMIALIVTVIAVLLVRIRKWFVRHYKRHRLKQNALHMLQEAGTAQELLTALRHFALAEGWPGNLTLSDFLNHWRQRYYAPTEFGVLLQGLSLELYGGGSMLSVKEMQNKLLQHMRQTRRIRQSPKYSPNSVWENKNIFIRQP